MKKSFAYLVLFIFGLSALAFSKFSNGQSTEPWTPEQLMDPAALAKTINDPNAKKPVIFSIGPSGLIKNAIQIGSPVDPANLEKLRIRLGKLPKNASIVIYCGCCKFEHCPNIRPAFKLLNDMKFTNSKLLNLTDNLKVDWIDKGYPMEM
jgi:thiosulfate/3-mercaptopyruvate sulfurtransferase